MSRFNLSGKRVLLVGSTGVLGRTFARTLVEEGARVVLADLPTTDVADLARDLGSTCRAVDMDVADEVAVVSGVAEAVSWLGGLDGAVNNAAVTSEGLAETGDAFAPFEEYPLAAWQKALDVNLTGTFLVAREAGAAIKSCGGGSLVNISSIYGVVAPDHRIYEGQPFRSFASYSASKAGVLGLTRWLATWWGKDGVRVNAITPGGVYNNHSFEFAEAYGNRTPLGRMADRGDIAGMLIYLLSDASRYCTGQNFVVDGGLSAW